MSLRPVRLPPGADLRVAIEQLGAGLPQGSGFVVSGIGSLTEARLRMADQAEGQRIPGPLEIVSLAGSISPDGAHLHMAVANAQGQVCGGHVCTGCTIRTTAELLLADVPGYRLSRAPDAATGFDELVVHPTGPPPTGRSGRPAPAPASAPAAPVRVRPRAAPAAARPRTAPARCGLRQ